LLRETLSQMLCVPCDQPKLRLNPGSPPLIILDPQKSSSARYRDAEGILHGAHGGEGGCAQNRR